MTTIKDIINLVQNKINVCIEHDDGRINSIQDESSIINVLKKELGNRIEVPPMRHWWDFKIDQIPVQFKSSNFKTSDNFNSKQAILYALTNLSERGCENVKSWADFEKALLTSETSKRDYNIIVLNKNTYKLHHYTLKSLSQLQPNGSNLPFQINWSKQVYTERSPEEAYQFIIDTYKQSVLRKINAHPLFNQL